MGEVIEQETIKRQFPRLQADYRANRPIVFPGLCINQNWISKSEEKLRWHEVAQIIFGPEQLVIKERGKTGNWLAAPLAQFPNICLLEALLISIKEEHDFGLDSI